MIFKLRSVRFAGLLLLAVGALVGCTGAFGPVRTSADGTFREQKIDFPGKDVTLSGVLFTPTAALDYLARQADIDVRNVFILGWSHGGSTVTGVVRSNALEGRAATDPRFKAAVAFYPGCDRPLRQKVYEPTMPLLILHGAADDWSPAAPCVELAERLKSARFPVQTIVYPDAMHGFDAPATPVRRLPNVYNPRVPGERGAHLGTHEASRLKAIEETRRFLERNQTMARAL